jgi:hypothetical protein
MELLYIRRSPPLGGIYTHETTSIPPALRFPLLRSAFHSVDISREMPRMHHRSLYL